MVFVERLTNFIHYDYTILKNAHAKKTLFYSVFLITITSVAYFMIFHHRLLTLSLPFLGDLSDLDKYKLKFKNYNFHPVNDKGVYSFWNVCIEAVRVPLTKQINVFGKAIQYNESKRIVVYNSFYRDGPQQLHTVDSSNSYSHEWDITFTRRSIPAGHTFHPVTAFFIIPTCPANFHHFWIDEFVPLYTVIKQGNRLKPRSDNRLFYKQPIDLREDFIRDCTNVSTFETLLKYLYVKFPHDTFFKIPDGSCFSSGVFGTTTAYLSSPRDVVEHVLKTFYGTLQISRTIKSNCSLLFLNRHTRKILNIEKLMNSVRSMGLTSLCELVFEDLTVEQQLYAASHAKVMIGVQGAGLQWAVFMSSSSHLIEIAWPQKHWGFYFQNYVQQYGIRHHKIVANHIKPNWTSYENQVRGGIKVGMEERLEILRGDKIVNSFDHFWKWADAIVDENDLTDVLQDLAIDL